MIPSASVLGAPIINGVEPGWAQLTFSIGGVSIVGITKISYSQEQKKEKIYGFGGHAVGVGYGNYEAKCSVTLLRSAVEAIRSASPTGRLQDVAPFDIVVCYIPVSGGKMFTHKIRNCEFTSDGVDVSQGDMKNETSFELLTSYIDYK